MFPQILTTFSIKGIGVKTMQRTWESFGSSKYKVNSCIKSARFAFFEMHLGWGDFALYFFLSVYTQVIRQVTPE